MALLPRRAAKRFNAACTKVSGVLIAKQEAAPRLWQKTTVVVAAAAAKGADPRADPSEAAEDFQQSQALEAPRNPPLQAVETTPELEAPRDREAQVPQTTPEREAQRHQPAPALAATAAMARAN